MLSIVTLFITFQNKIYPKIQKREKRSTWAYKAYEFEPKKEVPTEVTKSAAKEYATSVVLTEIEVLEAELVHLKIQIETYTKKIKEE